MADFAKAQLLKYGWTEGKGLGKNEDGINEALKPKLKFDTTGIGHNTSEFQWWGFVFNKASNNIIVDNSAENIVLQTQDKNENITIRTTKPNDDDYEEIKKNNMLYGSFIKTCTLQGDKLIENNDNKRNKMKKKKKKEKSLDFTINDEDLFKACEGRTAHKGARHGLKLNGKLARIEKQEQELLEKMNCDVISLEHNWTEVKMKKRKLKKNNKSSLDVDTNDCVDGSTLHTVADPKLMDNCKSLSKKTKRKVKRRIEDLTHQLEVSLDLQDPIENKSKKLKHQSDQNDYQHTSEKDENLISHNPVKKKKKKKDLSKINNSIQESDDNLNQNEILPSEINITVDINENTTDEKNKASYLNHKITKKKRKKLEKKHKKIIKDISHSIMSLDLKETLLNNEICEIKELPTIKKKKKKKVNK